MSQVSPMPDVTPMPDAGATTVKTGKQRPSLTAEEVRFQRFYIAISCILAVILNEPRILYPVAVFSAIVILTTIQFDPPILIYRFVLAKILRGDLWKIHEDSAGKYLLGNAAEKFMFTVLGIFVFGGLYLQHTGADYWIVPIAVVAAGMSLAATTGICLMGLFFVQTRKLFSRSS